MRILTLLLLALAASVPMEGQEPSMEQDPSLNNLEHAEGYRTMPLGQFGHIERRGTGAVPMILIPGGGFGWDVFEDFMKTNEDTYDMFAVTLAGMGGTPAPPMPPEGTSYGEQTWIRGGIQALVDLIEKEELVKPVVVAHFMAGSQIGLRMAIDHPELVSGVVLLAGTAKMSRAEADQYSLEERIRYLDTRMAPQWFKTVTLETWNDNNFPPVSYSRDRAQGESLYAQVSKGPLPIFVRYLVEFWAADLTMELDHVRVPVLVVSPEFDEERIGDAASWLPYYFEDSWKGIKTIELIERVHIPDAHIFVWWDQPEKVNLEVERFIGALSR